MKNFYAPHPYISIEDRKKFLKEAPGPDDKVRAQRDDEIILEFDSPITRAEDEYFLEIDDVREGKMKFNKRQIHSIKFVEAGGVKNGRL